MIPFGSIFGAILFACAFILSSVIYRLNNKTLKIDMYEILLPLGFTIGGILFLILVSLIYKKMNIYIASTILITYVIFILLVVLNERKKKKALKESLINSSIIQQN